MPLAEPTSDSGNDPTPAGTSQFLVEAQNMPGLVETASFEKLGTEIWQMIIEIIRGVSLSSVLRPAIHWSYPVRACPQNPMVQALSVVRQNLANINSSCRFLCMQVRLHRRTFPLAIQCNAETDEDWTRTLAYLIKSGNITAIRGWAMADMQLTQSKIFIIKELLHLSPPLTFMEMEFGMPGVHGGGSGDGTTASALELAMGTVFDRSCETLQVIKWSTSGTDILWKLREIDPPTLSELSVVYAHIYNENVVTAASRERRIWGKLHSLELIYDLLSGGRLSSAIRVLCRDYFPNVLFLELLPGYLEGWDTCIALLENCPSLRILVLNTYLLNKPGPMDLPILNTVTTVALNCGHISSIGLNFTPNASTIVLLSHCIMKDRAVERRLKSLYKAMLFIADHKTNATRVVKLKGVRVESIRARTWPSIVCRTGLKTFERMEYENITVSDHYGEILLGTDFKVQPINGVIQE